jgi:hypothetical protein
MNKWIIIISIILPATVFANGGGGLILGRYTYNSKFSNTKMENVGLVGGYGYGVNSDGQINGGFGLAIQDATNQYNGGFGGIITGYEYITGNIRIATTLWAGVGSFSSRFSGLGEFNLEAGYLFTNWFVLSAYGGIQGITYFDQFLEDGVYSPVVGLRFTFGSFKSS